MLFITCYLSLPNSLCYSSLTAFLPLRLILVSRFWSAFKNCSTNLTSKIQPRQKHTRYIGKLAWVESIKPFSFIEWTIKVNPMFCPDYSALLVPKTQHYHWYAAAHSPSQWVAVHLYAQPIAFVNEYYKFTYLINYWLAELATACERGSEPSHLQRVEGLCDIYEIKPKRLIRRQAVHALQHEVPL